MLPTLLRVGVRWVRTLWEVRRACWGLLCLLCPEASQKLLFSVLENQYPGRAYGEPLDIANGVRFLCSSEAKFITGHTLSIDGGLTIQLQEDLGMRQADFKEEQLKSRL